MPPSGGAWTHIPAEKVTALTEHNTAWHTAYAKTIGPHTSGGHGVQKRRSQGGGRLCPSLYSAVPGVRSRNQRGAHGNAPHNRDTAHSDIPIPATRAIITDLKALGDFQVGIRFQDEAAPTNNAIPYGDNGCLLNFTYGPEKVTNYTALTQPQLIDPLPVGGYPAPGSGKFLSCATRSRKPAPNSR
jgi:hypothetical protein